MTFDPIGNRAGLRWHRDAAAPLTAELLELRRQLEQAGGVAANDPELASLRSLTRESDPEILSQSILYLGRQAAARGSERAALFFQFLESRPEGGALRVPEAVLREARLELQTLAGEGGLGRRLERSGRSFAREVMDPGMLIGMGVAGAVFSGIRLTALSRLAARPAGFLTRGAAAQFLAGGLAFPGEVGSFWLTNRLYQQAVHPERVSWSAEAIGHELLGTTLTLGLLKLGGAASQRLFDRVHGVNPLTGSATRLTGLAGVSRPLFTQLGMYGGIVGGHWAEMHFGLRPRASTDGLLADSLVTLFQFHVAGRLSQGVLGPGHARLLQEMALRTQRLETSAPRFGDWISGMGLGGHPALATAGRGPRFLAETASRPDPLGNPNVLMAVNNGEGNGGAHSSGEHSISVTPISVRNPWDPTPALEAALRSLRESDTMSRSDRVKFAAELYMHYGHVREIVSRMLTVETEMNRGAALEKNAATVELAERGLKDINALSESEQDLISAAIGPAIRSLPAPRKGNGGENGDPAHAEILKWIEFTRLEPDPADPGKHLPVRRLPETPLRAELQELAVDSLRNRLRSEADAAHEQAKRRMPVEIAWVLHRIKRNHFETISDEIQIWYERFHFLQARLRQRSEKGNRKQRREMRRLLDSVSLKMLETRRYHFDAESYLAEDKGDSSGPSPKSAFNDKRYPELQRRFADISHRLQTYVERRPVLAKILKNHQVRPAGRIETMIAPNAVDTEFAKLNNTPEIEEIFREAVLELDPFLAGTNGVPIYRYLRSIHAQSEPGLYLEARKPIDQYLASLAALRGAGLEWDRVMGLGNRYLEALEKREDPELFRRSQIQALTEALGGETERLVTLHLEAAQVFNQALKPHQASLRDFMRIEWASARRHLLRLGERQILAQETVRGLLNWFDPPSGMARNQLMVAIREDAVCGLIDFVGKGTHTVEIRNEISRFLSQIVARADERMLQVLAIHFQNYQLGMMRDRLQVRNSPSADPLNDQLAVEAYDEFLQAILRTARFYDQSPNVKGFYLDIFLKLQGDRNDPNFQLAVPVMHRSEELLRGGFHVNLVSRGGIGESVLIAQHPDGDRRVIAVTSIVHPLENRQQLEVWLDRAERELLHNGEFAESDTGPTGRFISIHLPRIYSGVAKDTIRQWVGDYLKERSRLDGIDIYIPDKGNEVADVADRSFYRRISVAASSAESTEVLIERLKEEVAENPDDLRRRLELYRLRKSWAEHKAQGLNGARGRTREQTDALQLRQAEVQGLEHENWMLLQETARMFPAEKAVRTEFNRTLAEWFRRISSRDANYISARRPFGGRKPIDIKPLEDRQRLFIDFVDAAFGVRLLPRRVVNLLNLEIAGAEITDFYYSFGEGGLNLRGDIHLTPEQTHLDFEVDAPPTLRDVDILPQPKIPIDERPEDGRFIGPVPPPEEGADPESPEVENGHFNITLFANPRSGQVEIQFDHVTLPPRMRDLGIGRNFFGELIRLGMDLGAAKIVSSEISGDGRYKLARYGMQFRDRTERNKMLRHFRYFLENQMQLPGLHDYDLSELTRIRTPQDLANAFLDPETRSLSLEPPPDEGAGWQRTIPGHHYVGRLYLMNSAPSWAGTFLLNEASDSVQIFNAYYSAREAERPGDKPPHERN